eukprot:TRINITY_DN5372_c0_g1_i1.p1 TRINITY_DN5372_c0_g1~~TRINITY_DN5372_c0_g1_i1.p1  ORF type:complete len:622 (+),score=123.14 TRINITY_DN5372_c0_g1_i1:231-2096(+)
MSYPSSRGPVSGAIAMATSQRGKIVIGAMFALFLLYALLLPQSYSDDDDVDVAEGVDAIEESNKVDKESVVSKSGASKSGKGKKQGSADTNGDEQDANRPPGVRCSDHIVCSVAVPCEEDGKECVDVLGCLQSICIETKTACQQSCPSTEKCTVVEKTQPVSIHCPGTVRAIDDRTEREKEDTDESTSTTTTAPSEATTKKGSTTDHHPNKHVTVPLPLPTGVECSNYDTCSVDTSCDTAGSSCIHINGCDKAICIPETEACKLTCSVGPCDIMESYPEQLGCGDGDYVHGRMPAVHDSTTTDATADASDTADASSTAVVISNDNNNEGNDRPNLRRELCTTFPGTDICQPYVVGLGCMKCGSTSVYTWLNLHPMIKRNHFNGFGEAQFFSYHYEAGTQWYIKGFPHLTSDNFQNRVNQEKSPSYIIDPIAPPRLGAELPNAKFWLVLRDPVERAFSHYYFWLPRKEGKKDPGSFEHHCERDIELLDQCNEARDAVGNYNWESVPYCYPRNLNFIEWSYISRGIYVDQIRYLLRFVPLDRIHIIKAEELFADPVTGMKQLNKFLGLPMARWKSFNFKHTNPSKIDYQKDPETVNRLRRFFEPHNKRLENLLGKKMWDYGDL